MCIAPEDRVYFFCLYLEYLALTQLFYTSFLLSVVMKCKHFSKDRKTGCHGIVSLFKNNFYTLPKVSKNKRHFFYTLDPSMLQSIPFYIYLIMQGNICLSSPSLACGWNMCQYIIAPTRRNSFKLILRESLQCLLFHRVGSTTNWQGILEGWNNECFLSLRNNYWMLWVRLTNSRY